MAETNVVPIEAKETVSKPVAARNAHDYVTVLYAAAGKAANKVASVDKDGKVKFKAGGIRKGSFAYTVHVPNIQAMQKLLEEISDQPEAIIVQGFAPDTLPKAGEDSGADYAVLSQAEFKRAGGDMSAGSIQWVRVPDPDAENTTCLATCLNADWWERTNWQQIDWDRKDGMPENMSGLSEGEFIERMGEIITGLDRAALLRLGSSSKRVVLDGKPATTGGVRFWFQTVEPMENLSQLLRIRAAAQGYAYRTERVAQYLFDPCVYSRNRLAFDGAPAIKKRHADRLTLAPADIQIVRKGGRVDLRLIDQPTIADRQVFEKVTKQRLPVIDGKTTATASAVVDENNLTLNTKIETKDYGTLSVQDYLAQDLGDIRCQATFRQSTSWNGMLNLNPMHMPFLWDRGGETVYRLTPEDGVKFCMAYLTAVIADDPAQMQSERAVKRFAYLKAHARVEANKIRNTLKKTRTVPLADFDTLVTDSMEDSNALNHIQLAVLARNEIGSGNIVYNGGDYWRWEDTHWVRAKSEEHIKTVVQGVFKALKPNDKWRGSDVSDVVRVLAPECTPPRGSVRWDSGAPTAINVLNGTLHWSKSGWGLTPHNRGDYFTACLPVTYDPAATCPMFDKYMAEVFEGDEDAAAKVQFLLEAMGYTLTRECKFEKVILLMGDGGNGKSVFLHVLKEMIGSGNISSVPMHELESPYNRAHMHGKLANITTEIDTKALLADGALKMISSGEQVTVQHKHKDPFEAVLFATPWQAGNTLPATKDTTMAIRRRVSIIRFNRTFVAGKDANENLKDDIAKTELSGVLNRALTAYVNLAARSAFTYVPSAAREVNEWLLGNNSVEYFINENLTRDPEGKMKFADFYDRYRAFCVENNLRSLSSINAGRKLELCKGVRAEKGTGNVKLVHGLAF